MQNEDFRGLGGAPGPKSMKQVSLRVSRAHKTPHPVSPTALLCSKVSSFASGYFSVIAIMN